MQFVVKWLSFEIFLAPQEHIWRYLAFKAIPEKRDFAVGMMMMMKIFKIIGYTEHFNNI